MRSARSTLASPRFPLAHALLPPRPHRSPSSHSFHGPRRSAGTNLHRRRTARTRDVLLPGTNRPERRRRDRTPRPGAARSETESDRSRFPTGTGTHLFDTRRPGCRDPTGDAFASRRPASAWPGEGLRERRARRGGEKRTELLPRRGEDPTQLPLRRAARIGHSSRSGRCDQIAPAPSEPGPPDSPVASSTEVTTVTGAPTHQALCNSRSSGEVSSAASGDTESRARPHLLIQTSDRSPHRLIRPREPSACPQSPEGTEPDTVIAFHVKRARKAGRLSTPLRRLNPR